MAFYKLNHQSFNLIAFSPFSVAIPFSGDAINLGSNPNWSKVKAKQETLIQLNFVENVTKINRADGKVIDIITRQTVCFVWLVKVISGRYLLAFHFTFSSFFSPFYNTLSG